jgi:beta-ureidopropionase / N-carbamoyl-L-amino-acid hydrolase
MSMPIAFNAHASRLGQPRPESMTDMTRPNLTIDPARLWSDLMETARFGGTPRGGIRRLALSEEDRQVRDWFRATCEGLGCTVTIDDVGTMFARRAGLDNSLPPIAIGSHLDTQPTGGRFDGVLGVLAGIEVLRTMVAAGYVTTAPIEVINWTNEEGSRFAPAMLASGVFAGVFTPDDALGRLDREGIAFGTALDSIGYRGAVTHRAHKLGAMFELHIEQGPILEAEDKTIGIVTGVQGARWHEVTVTGQDAHTGATPMHLRKDALLGAARVVAGLNALAARPEHSGTNASVGLLEVSPNSRNTVPGSVFFCVDLRHPLDARIDALEVDFRALLAEALTPLGLTWEEACIWSSPAVQFDSRLIDCVRHGAARHRLPTRELVSGAGHDAAYIARVAPTTMIFVPCAGGVSHNESESATLEDCGAGTQVLLEAVIDCDQRMNGV